jgi:S1-C subfamily serine protease
MSSPTTAARVAAAALAVLALAGCAADPPSAVVGLAVTGCPPGTAHGSGIFVEPGLVLTSAHVVKGADEIAVTNGEHSATATIIAFDPEMDLAYLAVDPFAAPVDVADGDVERGATGTAYVFRDGAVVALPVVVRRPIQIHTEDIYIEGDTYRSGLELDADIRGGDSGGPVLVDGEVVGVVWARSSKFDRRAYAIDPVGSGELLRRQLASGEIGDSIDLARCT